MWDHLYRLQADKTAEAVMPESVGEAVEEANVMMNLLGKFTQDYIVPFVITLLIALLVYLIGRKLIGFCMKIVEKSFERAQMEISAAKFLNSVIRALLHVLLLFVVAGVLGVGTSSIVAIVGSCGLAIGLALQGSLSNFAGGVLLLLLKPFVVGDYIIAAGCEGKVISIDIIYTRLMTADNRLVTVPNGTMANSEIINVTSQDKRRLDLAIAIDYSEDIKRVRQVLLEVVKENPSILAEEEVMVFVSDFAASAVTIGLRAWVKTEEYLTVRSGLLEAVKEAFDREQIVIPYDQLDVNIHQ